MCVCCLYFVLLYHQLKHSNGVCLLLNTAGSIFTRPTLILEAFESWAAPMVSDIARNAKDSFKESRLILFSLIMHCKFTSVTWYRILLTIYTIGELLRNFEVPHLWWQFIHCIFHLPEMYNLCTDTTRCLPGRFSPWKTWGCRDVLPRCQWKVEI